MSMPAQKIRPVMEQYEKMTDNFFKKRLQRKIKPQKAVLMERTLEKYHEEKLRQENSAKMAEEEVKQREFEGKAQKRRAELNKLQRNAGFMDEWLEKGFKEWRVNILKKKKREKEDEKFKLRQAEMTLVTLKKTKQTMKDETYREISQFEERMQSTKKGPEVKGEESAEEMEMPMAQTTEELVTKPMIQRDSKYKQLQYNKEREQRRRKMLMDQSKMHKELDAKRREDDLIERMNRLSRQEQELEYEIWRTGQCKAIIEENRKLREARYRKREELDTDVVMIREEEALTALKNQLTITEGIEKERADNYIVARNQYKHNNNSTSCQEFLDLIFDLSDEVYKHQQILDNPEMDQRNWREWSQLFVDKLPMKTNSPLIYSEGKLEVGMEDANARVDYLEMLDYLASSHQWVRAGESAEKLINNFNLGNIVRTLITWSYPSPPKPDRPKLALDVKLKLSIVGYAYGGKKTQANKLMEKHGIALISIEELIKSAFEESQPIENDAETIKRSLKEKDPELEKLGAEIRQTFLEGKEITDEMAVKLIIYKLKKLFGFYSKADYYNKVRQERVKELENVKDTVPVEEVKEPEPEAKEVIEDSSKEEEPMQNDEELEGKAEEQLQAEEGKEIELEPHDEVPGEEIPNDQAEEQLLEEEGKAENEAQEMVPTEQEIGIMREPEGQKVKGFILVDFPSTLSQAKLLEEALTGYICDEDKEIEVKDQLLSEASVLVAPTPLPPVPKQLISSGLDAVLWLRADKTECIRRAFGLKKDVSNDCIYHILYNPPPTTKNDVVEKLQPAIDSELLNSMLTDRHIAFDMAHSALIKWLKRFGDEKRSRCLLQEIETPGLNMELPLKEAAIENIKTVHEIISEAVNKTLDANNEEENMHTKGIEEELEYAKKVTDTKLDFERNYMIYEDEIMKYTMRQEQKKALEEAEAERMAKESKKDPRKDAKGKKEAKKEVKKDAKKEAKKEAEESKEEQEEHKEEEKIPEPPELPIIPPLHPENNVGIPEIQIEDQFKCNIFNKEIAVLLNSWKLASNIYTTTVKKNMRQIRQQRELIIKDVNNLQVDMLTLLEKPQPRQKLIDDYIQIYNKFLDDNLDMIEDLETKMEMHQRVEDLSAKLIELVDDLQKTSLAKRESVMKSGWVEYQLEELLVCTQSLMQSEVNRYRCFVNFAEDFYAAKDGRPLSELAEESLFEPIVDGTSLPLVEYESEDCPRLDLLYQSAMGVVTGEVPVAVKDPKGKKEAKKEAKKAAKKELAKKKEEEAKPAEENKELIAVIDAEKSILKYRLGMIKEWSDKRVKEMKGTCKSLYDRLVDWIRVTIKCQKEAINQLSMRLREAIEEERKIQKEIRMKSYDLIMDEKYLYFIIPPPKLLPGIEAVLDSRFSIVQLYSLIESLKIIVEPNGKLDLGLLIPLLTKKSKLGSLFGRDEGLPKDWNNYSYSTYQQMAINMDKEKTGYVNFIQVATYFVLLESTLPTEKELGEYDIKLCVVTHDDCLTKEDFAKVEAWFDGYEECEQRERAEKFDRVTMIKELLFEINKNSKTNLLSKTELFKVLKASGIVNNLEELATKGRHYTDILFSKL